MSNTDKMIRNCIKTEIKKYRETTNISNRKMAEILQVSYNQLTPSNLLNTLHLYRRVVEVHENCIKERITYEISK